MNGLDILGLFDSIVQNEELTNEIFSNIANIETVPRMDYVPPPEFDTHLNGIQSDTYYMTQITQIAFDINPHIEMICPYVGRKRFRYFLRFRRSRRRRRNKKKKA